MSKQEKLKYACMICGTPLVYAEESKKQRCVYCGEEQISAIYCPNGHFVCDECHASDAISLLQRMAEMDTSDNPRNIVESAFGHPSFSFHGPEHHSLVPAAILIALKNRGIRTTSNEEISTNMILEGIRRGAQIPGGFCGYAGDCGACVGAGIAVALFVGSTPTKAEERFQAHKATVKALSLAEDSLIRCCKRSTLYGITAAIEFLADEYGIELGDVPESNSCQQWQRNRDCAKEDCYFFPGE